MTSRPPGRILGHVEGKRMGRSEYEAEEADEERERERHKSAVAAFFKMPKPKLKAGLGEALYAASEMSMFPDDASVSEEQAIYVWKIVEAVRAKAFPRALGM